MLAKFILVYLLIINVTAFAIYGIDKYKARKSLWRIPEAWLLALAAVGGSIGALIGIQVWHHKTLHKKFSYGVPAILILQLALAVWLLWREIMK